MNPKHCEVCKKEIPADYVNLLCDTCYRIANGEFVSGIMDPNYVERPEAEEIDMISRAHGRFKGTGLVMPQAQRELYTAIKHWIRQEYVMKNVQFSKFIWKPKIVDIGCGLGVGANILSQEADYVLGIDKNKENIAWCKQQFTREKNEVYHSSQVDFIELGNDKLEFMKFDIVTCIEVFEHVADFRPLMDFVKRLAKPDAYIFISTPNRNADAIQKDTPRNEHHVREHTSQEFVAVMKRYFKEVTLMDYNLNPLKEDTDITPIVARCKI